MKESMDTAKKVKIPVASEAPFGPTWPQHMANMARKSFHVGWPGQGGALNSGGCPDLIGLVMFRLLAALGTQDGQDHAQDPSEPRFWRVCVSIRIPLGTNMRQTWLYYKKLEKLSTKKDKKIENKDSLKKKE